MKHPRFLVSTVVLLILTMTVATFAQEVRRGGRGRGRFRGAPRSIDKTALLRSDQVRKEVKVTEEQAGKIDATVQLHRKKSRDLFSSFDSSGPSDEQRKEMRAKRAALTKETVAALEAILEENQTVRLNEIELQAQGVQGLVSDRCVAALKLSEEQLNAIKAIVKSRDEAMRGFGRRGRGEGGDGDRRARREEFREKLNKLNEESETAALALLSEEQNETLKKLKGEPFELDRRSLGGRGRPGGDGGRGRKKRQRPPADDA